MRLNPELRLRLCDTNVVWWSVCAAVNERFYPPMTDGTRENGPSVALNVERDTSGRKIYWSMSSETVPGSRSGNKHTPPVLTPIQEQIQISRTFSRQKFTCVTCSATFSGKEELRLHVVSHTGDMPHKVSPAPQTSKITSPALVSLACGWS